MLVSVIAFFLGLFADRIRQSWSIKYQIATDHFDDLKELVIKPLLNMSEGRRYGTDGQGIDNFLFEDLKENHYPEVKNVLEDIDKLQKEYYKLHDFFRKKLFEFAEAEVNKLKIDWFDVRMRGYESLYEHILRHSETPVERDLQTNIDKIPHGEKTIYRIKIGAWQISEMVTENEAERRGKLILKLLNNMRTSDSLLNLKDELQEAGKQLASQREELKGVLRKILYSKRLKGECELINHSSFLSFLFSFV